MQRITFCLVFCFVLLVPTFKAQQQYRYDIIATSSASRQIFAAPSINNNGEVAFAGRNNPGGGGIFTDYLPNSPIDLQTGFSSQSAWTSSPQLQINDSKQIIAWWSNFTTTPIQNYLFLVDGRQPNAPTQLVAAANGTGGFNDVDEIWPTGITFANGTLPVFQTRSGNDTSVLTSGVRPNLRSRTYVPTFGSGFRPMVSDNDTAVVRYGGDGTSPIVVFDRDRLLNQHLPQINIATTSEGFSQIGQSPSISKKDEAIAFYADLNQTGATALGTNPGPGIFVSIKLANGTRKIVRIAGRLVEDNSAQGGNDDGVCDSGETCVQGELGTTTTGNRIFFNSFDQNSRIDVAYIASKRPGLQDDLVMVSFIATPNIASDVPGRAFSNQTGLWTQVASIADNNATIPDPDKAVSVAQVGASINGNTVTQISVYDQIANSVDRVAFWAGSATGNMIIRAVRDPGTPVVFIAGVGGSELRHPSTNERLWFPESLSNDVTPLAIGNSVKVPDVMRKFKVGLVGGLEATNEVYESLINSLKESGYTEYDLGGNENNRNSTCGGQAADQNQLAALRAKHPTLFVFPYDWRKSNGDTGPTGNTTKLKEYIECVRAIYPDSKVNIVAHSMGGLLGRRYILANNGANHDHNVKTMVTIGTPWLGAPRGLHALETGSFISEAWVKTTSPPPDFGLADILFAPQIKQIVEAFPGAHELFPSQKYFELGGRPLRVSGTDLGYVQVRDWINARHSSVNPGPGTNGETFHSFAGQDDFQGDATGVNYYHIYGRQPYNRTVGRIEPRNWFLTAVIPGQRIYSDFSAYAVAGDGTVPIISSSRRIDATDGLNATCGSANDRRCIGVCYSENDDPAGDLSQHNGMTSNPQVQSQVLQILKFSDGLISQNPEFDPAQSCHLPPNNFAPSSSAESHYVSMTGISGALITDAQGNDNAAVSTAYKKIVPGVTELVVGPESLQVMTPTNNTYTMRFTGNGQLTRIEDVRGTSNDLSAATYIVRYDDLVIPNGAVAELRIVNDQVDSLKYDSNNDGTPDLVIQPSRIITNPQTEDLQPPTVSVNWGLNLYTRSVTVTATDLGSGVKRIYYRLPYNTNFGYTDGNWARFKVIKQGSLGWRFDLVTEDNAGNRTDVVTYTLQ